MKASRESNDDRPRHDGMFKPGQSGNPSGRPKSDHTIRELAKAHTTDALQTLVDIAQNKNASPSARVQAATALLDRGWGRPAQYVESVTMGMTYIEFLDTLADGDSCESSMGV